MLKGKNYKHGGTGTKLHVELHTRLDKKFDYESPNSFWPPDLIEYYNNKKEVKENEENT